MGVGQWDGAVGGCCIQWGSVGGGYMQWKKDTDMYSGEGGPMEGWVSGSRVRQMKSGQWKESGAVRRRWCSGKRLR